MPYRRIAVLVPVVALFAGEACSSSSSSQCQVGADCASGECSSTGQCVPVTTKHVDAGVTPSDSGVMPTVDAMPDPDEPAPFDAPAGSEGGAGCQPSANGVIARDQIPMTAGLHAVFLIAENATVDTAGTMNPDGSRTWDFSASLSGDHTATTTTNPPTGQWFSSM